MTRSLLACLVAVAVLVASVGPAVAAERHFPETGQTAQGAFLDFFEAHGGVDVFGYPRTGEVQLNGRTVQYFQRARFEWWPENPPAHRVQLGLLADELGRGRPPAGPPADLARRYFPETGHSIGGAFRDFWERRGSLAVFGFPTTEESQENGRPVQYFQRARFEWHVENREPYRVLLGLLGDEQIALGRVAVPSAAAVPSSARTPGQGRLVVSTGVGRDFYLMSPTGADVRRLGRGVDPALSPDGLWVAFGLEDVERPGLYVQPVDGAEPRLIHAGKGVRGPVYSPSGAEIAFYQRSDCLREIRPRFFEDDSCFQVKVIPAGGGQDWLPPGQGRYARAPTWSPDGRRLVYREAHALFVVSRDTTSRQLSAFDPLLRMPAWSPRGGRIAVARDMNRSHYEIGLIPDDGSVQFEQLTQAPPFRQPPSTSVSPAWSPDGARIAFASDRDGVLGVWLMNADGSNPVKVSDLPLHFENSDERLISWGGGGGP